MSTFEKDFLNNYLKLGLGSMPKSDIDALVMHLLDTYGLDGSPMAIYSNQTVSERLKTPVTKIKKLRYESALKFGERIEDQARGRLLAALSKASLEPEGEKICLIIEDSLAKNWFQGQLKTYQHIYDYSFNTEIVKVSAEGLFEVLSTVFDKDEIETFKNGYDNAKKKKTKKEMLVAFKGVVRKFAEGAATAAGSGVVKVLRAHIGI
ncbi:MAG: hypothetical protein K2Y28_03590 [Burkholderiaceae bacterium]|nr:hypothetical protein [Burkholderiaceae bacterium]